MCNYGFNCEIQVCDNMVNHTQQKKISDALFENHKTIYPQTASFISMMRNYNQMHFI